MSDQPKKEESLKNQIKAFRKQVREMQESFNPLYHAVLAQIVSDDQMNITTDKGKLQFYLMEELTTSFHNTASILHKLWDSFPELVKDNPEVEAALRQAMKDFHGQPFVFDGQLEWTVKEAQDAIHAMRHAND